MIQEELEHRTFVLRPNLLCDPLLRLFFSFELSKQARKVDLSPEKQLLFIFVIILFLLVLHLLVFYLRSAWALIELIKGKFHVKKELEYLRDKAQQIVA